MNAPIIDPTAGRAAWITDELRAKRTAAAAPYADAKLEELHETSKITIKPKGERVLIRAILKTDGSDLTLDTYDARDAIAHEIVGIGPGVAVWEREHGVTAGDELKVGQHCFVLSAAADRMDKKDRSVRLWMVHIEDISAAWDVKG